jgi:hypothetical protein
MRALLASWPPWFCCSVDGLVAKALSEGGPLGLALTQSNKASFKGRPFAAEILLPEVCWYLQLAIGYVELA